MSLPSFGVRKPVPVNLLWMAICVAGVMFGLTLRREFFPETTPDQALISAPYPGASPEEVEEALVLKIEEKLAQLDEIKETRVTVAEGGAGITVEFREGADVDKALDEVERAIDQLTDLPQDSEKIQTALFEPKLPVIRVNLFGDVDEDVLKRAIRGIRDDLRELPGMGEVFISGTRNYEIRIDVDHRAMLRHGISLPFVADTVRSWMTEVPGGTVRSSTGDVKVRTMGIAERAAAIRNIVLRADAQGRSIRVMDVATVAESFIDEQVISRFNGKQAASLTVFKVGDQDIVSIAEMVRGYVQGRNGETFEPDRIESVRMKLQRAGPQASQGSPIPRLLGWEKGVGSSRAIPPGVSIAPNSDLARYVEGRLDLLTRNATSGGILVFLTLLLFMSLRSAIWVTTGLITAIMGTLVLMAFTGVTLNLLTMFGLIIALGMLVDDGIVISENIETRYYKGEPPLLAAIKGAEEIMWPVVGTVTTTVVAFLPLLFIKGRIGTLMGALPAVVACALLMSVTEAIAILPSHMGHSLARSHNNAGFLLRYFRRFEQWRDQFYFQRVAPAFGWLVALLMRWRYATVAGAVGLMAVSAAMLVPFPSGRVKYDFLSSSDAETIVIDLRMPIGTPIDKTDGVAREIERVCGAMPEVKSIQANVGQRGNLETGSPESFTPHVGQILVELKEVEQREAEGGRESSKVVAAIRESLKGKLDEVERMTFTEISGGPGGPDITIRVRGENQDRIDVAVAEIKAQLQGFAGVYDVVDNANLGQQELRVNLKPSAASLGFTAIDVARQVRGFLFGLDAHTYAAEQEDIDVRVRLDEQSRRSLFAVENGWLISPQGKPVPLTEVATVDNSVTYSTITRINRQRAVTVTAETAPGITPEEIVSQLKLDEIRRRFPDLNVSLAGRQEQQSDAFASLPTGFLAANLMIYVILAWLFASYWQPFLVMLSIPFSIVGVVWGHYLFGYDMTFLSMIGYVALAGVVVNNAIVLVEFYNVERAQGKPPFESLRDAAGLRVRPIFLTSLTTVFGLLPLILEKSFQAKFLIPMAITLAVGLAASAVMVLLVLPCVMMILDDLGAIAYFLWHGRRREYAATQAAPATEQV